jgi:hypothetical protein
VDRSRRLSKQLFAIHPSAHVLSSVRVNNSDLIFITVVVRHLFFLPSARMVSDFLEATTTFPRRDHRLAQQSSGVQHTRVGEV